MILKKEFDIMKRPYLTPRIEFEEIESDEIGLLINGSVTDSQGHDFDYGDGDQDPESLSADFVMNDVNGDFKW